MRVRLVVMLGLATDHHDDPSDGIWTANDTFET
jgi:hypothetical protein